MTSEAAKLYEEYIATKSRQRSEKRNSVTTSSLQGSTSRANIDTGHVSYRELLNSQTHQIVSIN